MKTVPELPDVQWCLLDILIRAKHKGVARVNRHELLYADALPEIIRVQLVWNALLMSGGPYVTIHGQHDFEVTDEGEQIFNLKFGKPGQNATPTKVADIVIALPDRSREVLQ